MGLHDRDYARSHHARAASPIRGWLRVSAWSFTTWLIVINIAVFVTDALLFKAGRQWSAPVVVQTQPMIDPSTGRAVLRAVTTPMPILQAYGHFSTGRAFLSVQKLGQQGQGGSVVVWGLEVWRFISFQFLHAGEIHLFFNMFGLYMFGEMVERRLGFKRYAAFYLICGIFGALMFLILNFLGQSLNLRLPGLLVTSPYTPLIGASAGVFGVLMAAAYYQPNALMQILFLPISMRLRTLVYGYVALAAVNLLFAGKNAGGDAAHLGGAIAGAFFVRRSHLLHDFFDILGPPRNAKPGRATRAVPARSGAPQAPAPSDVDRILDKVAAEGIASLSERERETLRQATQAGGRA